MGDVEEIQRVVRKLEEMLQWRVPKINVYYDAADSSITIDPPEYLKNDSTTWKAALSQTIFHLCRLNHPDWNDIRFPKGVCLNIGPFLFDTLDDNLYQDKWSLTWLKSKYPIIDRTQKMKYIDGRAVYS